MKYYLAIDIGASSGRHLLGQMENGIIKYEEIHRFKNEFVKKNGEYCWDYQLLFKEIICGMRKCKELDKIPISVGIDTWGVDFVLLDKNGDTVGSTVCYRDLRTNGMDEEVCKIISREDLYSRAGISFQLFNTIYQLMAVKKNNPEYLERSEVLLLVPDYLHYLLCGVKKSEYTEASTSSLLNVHTGNWDYELIEKLGFPKNIFAPIVMPGEILGSLLPNIQEQVGYDCKVVLPATHDTASAIAAVPSQKENTLYLSSGTWSLMGVELDCPDCSEESRLRNFTNEGGYNKKICFLKNIMGLWIIQSVKRELKENYSYAQLCDMASQAKIATIINCNDDRFMSPENMIQTIKQVCAETSQQIPETPGELAAVIYNSLAAYYHNTLEELSALIGKNFDSIHVVGGGANAEYLNRLTAEYTNKTVYAGPIESTAIGNLAIQMIADGVIADLQQARQYIAQSFLIKKFASEKV